MLGIFLITHLLSIKFCLSMVMSHSYMKKFVTWGQRSNKIEGKDPSWPVIFFRPYYFQFDENLEQKFE